MPRYSYVNGRYVPHAQATTHIEDRGFQFADGIYEVIACINGQMADERGHLDRLERSLDELGMNMPVTRQTLQFIIRELLRRNRLKNAAVYIQVTRGVAKRDFKFPDSPVTPQSLVLTCWHFDFAHNPDMEKGIKVITTPDLRWKRRDIKTIALLPQALAKQKAVEAGAKEAWMVDDEGFITEGASSNAWIVKGNTLYTRKANTDILKGVTRTALMSVIEKMELQWAEKSFTPEEAYEADEAFNTSATSLVLPVIEIDGHKIKDGAPGPVARRLIQEYHAYASQTAEKHVKWVA